MSNLQVGIDVWQMVAGLAIFFTAGIVRVELLAYRVRELERERIQLEKQVFALRAEINTVSDGLVGQISEIKEILAWIKGRFSMLEETHAAGR